MPTFRKREEYEDYLKTLPKAYCHLCDHKWIKENKILEMDGWVVAVNQFPYKEERNGLQLMLFPKYHSPLFVTQIPR